MTHRLNQSALDGVVPGSVTAQEVANIARDSVGSDWTTNGCTDFVYGVTYLAGAPFFDPAGVKAFVDGDPLMVGESDNGSPTDTTTGFVVPHKTDPSHPSWKQDQTIPEDGWYIVNHDDTAASIKDALQVGDVVRAYRDPSETVLDSGDPFVGHEFIVSRK